VRSLTFGMITRTGPMGESVTNIYCPISKNPITNISCPISRNPIMREARKVVEEVRVKG